MKSLKNGQSFIEVILALAVFAGLVATVTTMITGGISLVEQSSKYIQAAGYAQSGIEIARALHQDAWNAVSYTSSSTETIGVFTRTTQYSAVCRDLSYSLASCPASYTDVQSKLATVTVDWEVRPGVSNTVTRSSYITNWNSRDWDQTDWVGGSGQTLWSDTTAYDSGDSINATGTPGTVRLSDAPDGQWSLSGGGIFTDTTDVQFNQGSTISTAVQGSGESARIDLLRSIQWAVHQDSASTTSRDINALSALSSTNIWGAADNGEILKYNGIDFSIHSDVGSAHLRGIHMRTTSDGWAVGQTGSIYRYNGSTWALAVDTGPELWFDVYAFSDSNVWVAGSSDEEGEDGGRIAHYDGSSWSEVTPPSDHVIYAISAISATDIWAAGKSGRIWHYDGVSWTLHTDTGGEVWRDIAMISSSYGWAVGDSGALAKWDGVAWSKSTIPSSENIRGMYALSSTDIWATGNSGRIWHYDGTAWSLHTDMGDQNWRSIVMTSINEGWLGGTAGRIGAYGLFYDASGTFTSRVLDSGNTGTLWSSVSWIETLTSGSDVTVATRTGNTSTPDGSWSAWSNGLTNPLGSAIASPSPRRYAQYRLTLTRGIVPAATPRVDKVTIIYNLATSQNLRTISVFSSSDVWAAGNSGKIIHYDGSAWSEFTDTGSETWNDSAFTDVANGWVVGDGGSLARWDGSSWSESTVPSSADIKALYAISSSDVWAVGTNGRIWHYNGSSWTLYTDTGDEIWNDIIFTSASSGWVVGNNGALALWNGSTWSESIIPSSANILSLFALSSADIWASGATGRIWHYNGSSWTLHTDTGDEVWNDIALINADDGWVVGSTGAIRRWTDSSWIASMTPTSQTLESSAFSSAKLGFAVGQGGTVIEFFREAVYLTAGSLQSSAFNMTDASPVQSIEWTNINANCVLPCQLRFQLRSAPDNAGVPGIWTSWQGESGEGTYFTTSSGSLTPLALNGNVWVQYRAELLSDGTSTPILSDTKINYK